MAEEVDDGSVTVALRSPIPVFADKVSTIKFRKPTGGDIIRVGNPVVFDPISDPPKITHDEKKMTVMMARLAGVPISSLDFLDPRDWTSCAWALSPFFMPTAGTV